MLKKNKTQNYTAGFTLVEALVAISILMIAIASPMTLAQKGLSTATLSKDQMIASFLAQDAIESVKNIRDQIAIRGVGDDWLDGTLLDKCICKLDDNCDFNIPPTKYCIIDSVATAEWKDIDIKVGASTPEPLKISYNSPTHFFAKYDYSGNNSDATHPSDSKFYRYINIKKSTSNKDEAVVSVRVSWTSSQGPQKIDIQNFIYNYSENF